MKQKSLTLLIAAFTLAIAIGCGSKDEGATNDAPPSPGQEGAAIGGNSAPAPATPPGGPSGE